MADEPPPSSPPDDWAFGDNYIQDTWQNTHQSLFGPVEPGSATAFYPINSAIKGVGTYTGQNNVGQPFTLQIIRHFQNPAQRFSEELTESELTAIAASGQQGGLFWGTMSTSQGSANVIGFSMAVGPGLNANGDVLPPQGIIPLMNHDTLMSAYLPNDPTTQADDFNFEMMAEGWTGPSDPGDPALCLMCANGSSWCPMQDPVIQLALVALASCLA